MVKKKASQIATVLAFEKKLVPSDGFLYGCSWETREESSVPLKLVEKSVRGTISNRLNKKMANDPLKLDAEVEKPNLQTVDNCALEIDQDTLKLHFTLKVLSGVEKPSACNSESFYEEYSKVTKGYIEEEGFSELAYRYAFNIANARFLWRNRIGTEKLEVRVKDLGSDENEEWVFDAKELGVKEFKENEKVKALAERIAQSLSGEKPFVLLSIDAYAKVGHAQEVYPSEELVFEKEKNKKSKILYSVNGIAAMHSQKIGNAIRTIDTWYPDFETAGGFPIAVEVYGAVTNMGRAFRAPKAKVDFYTLFDKYVFGEELKREEEHYVMAVLVRGGVFGAKE